MVGGRYYAPGGVDGWIAPVLGSRVDVAEPIDGTPIDAVRAGAEIVIAARPNSTIESFTIRRGKQVRTYEGMLQRLESDGSFWSRLTPRPLADETRLTRRSAAGSVQLETSILVLRRPIQQGCGTPPPVW